MNAMNKKTTAVFDQTDYLAVNPIAHSLTQNTKHALPLAFMASLALVAGCSQKSPPAPKPAVVITQVNGIPNRYQVKYGDTISKIANRYGLNWRELSSLNQLDSNHTIYIGQWLTLWQGDNIKALPKRLTFATNATPSNSPRPATPAYATPNTSTTPPASRPILVTSTPITPIITQTPPPPVIQQAASTSRPQIVSMPLMPTDTAVVNTTLNTTVANTVAPTIADATAPLVNANLNTINPNAIATMPSVLIGSSALMKFDYPVGKHNLVARHFGTPTNHGLTQGMFFSGKAGDVIRASLGGQVIQVNQQNARSVVVIAHKDGYTSSYFDLHNIQVVQGQSVATGDTLGNMAAQTTSGLALFEFRIAKNGQFIDPVSVLN